MHVTITPNPIPTRSHRFALFALLSLAGTGALPRGADAQAANTTFSANATVSATPAPATPAEDTAIIPVPRGKPGSAWMQKHDSFVDLAKAGNIDVLFVGDSITDNWRKPSVGLTVWNQYYAPLKAANFGISADRTQHVLWRLQNGEGQGFQPKVVVLLIGTNNTGPESRTNPTPRNTVPQAIAGVKAVVAAVRQDFPNAKILFLAIFPRGDQDDPQRQQVEQINQQIAALNDNQHVFFLDIGNKFLGPDGNIPRDIMTDKLHPTTKGCEIWAAAMQPTLTKLLRSSPSPSS
jgi:lysophospholipase L1-like esterase